MSNSYSLASKWLIQSNQTNKLELQPIIWNATWISSDTYLEHKNRNPDSSYSMALWQMKGTSSSSRPTGGVNGEHHKMELVRMEMEHKRHTLQVDGLEILCWSVLFCSLLRSGCRFHLGPFPSEIGARGTCQSYPWPSVPGHWRDGATGCQT